MMLALVSGAIHKIETKVSRQDKPNVYLVLRVTDGGDAVFWGIRVFSETAQQELAGLVKGDAVSAVGRMSAEVWRPDDGREPRASLSMVADKVTVLRKPTSSSGKAARDRNGPRGGHWESHRTTAPVDTTGGAFLEDGDLPW